MADSEQRLSRRELHDLVWSEALSELAKRYEISDVGLAKICKRLGVPRPTRGYWARNEKTRRDTRVELPPQDGEDPTVVLVRRTAPRGNVPRVVRPAVGVSRSLRNPHPLVSKLNQSRAKSMPPSRHDLVVLRRDDVPDVSVSGPLWSRGLRILDALFKALESRGHSVSVSVTRGRRAHTIATIYDTDLTLRLRERLETRPVAPSGGSPGGTSREVGLGSVPGNLRLTGQLELRILGLEGTGTRQSWGDSKSARLEERLGQAIVDIERAACVEAERSRRWAAQRKKWEEERALAEGEARRRAAEALRVENLRTKAGEMAEAQQIRALAAAVERSARSEDASRWVIWVRGVAEMLDPVDRIIAELEGELLPPDHGRAE